MLMNVQMTPLANGLRVVTASIPQVESVAMGVWIGVGGRHESQALSGTSHFIEHLLFKGTYRRSARAISQAIEGRGGYLNACTQEESTCFYARVASEHAAIALDVLMDMYLHPRFDPTELNKERGVIIEEIMMCRDQPPQVVEEMLSLLLWPDHPLGRSLAGTPEGIARVSRTAIRAFKAAHYVPANTVVVFAGKVAHAECVDRVARYTGSLAPGRRATARPVRATLRQERVALQTRKIEQTHLAFGLRLFGRTDERRYPLKILNVVLGENMSSRLFQTIREKHGLAYSIHSTYQLFAETGALVIAAGLDRKRTPRAVELILREILRLKATPVGARELVRAKDYAIGQIRLGLESTANQSFWLGENYTAFDRLISPEEMIQRLSGVEAEAIQRVAVDILRESRSSLALLVPDPVKGGESMLADLLGILE